MTSTLYLAGLTQWPDLDDFDFRWLLLDDTYTPDPVADEVIADLTGELTDGSYSRVVLTGSVISTTTDFLGGAAVRYDADAPTFPALDGATDAAWLVLARDVGSDDGDSPLLAAWAIGYNPVGVDFTPLLSPWGLHVHALVTESFWPAG